MFAGSCYVIIGQTLNCNRNCPLVSISLIYSLSGTKQLLWIEIGQSNRNPWLGNDQIMMKGYFGSISALPKSILQLVHQKHQITYIATENI